MTFEVLNLKTKWEIARAELQIKLKRFKVKPIEGSGLHIDPKKMAKDFDSHTTNDGRPPIAGAKDD